MTEISSKAKAASSKMVSGVAGRSMMRVGMRMPASSRRGHGDEGMRSEWGGLDQMADEMDGIGGSWMVVLWWCASGRGWWFFGGAQVGVDGSSLVVRKWAWMGVLLMHRSSSHAKPHPFRGAMGVRSEEEEAEEGCRNGCSDRKRCLGWKVVDVDVDVDVVVVVVVDVDVDVDVVVVVVVVVVGRWLSQRSQVVVGVRVVM